VGWEEQRYFLHSLTDGIFTPARGCSSAISGITSTKCPIVCAIPLKLATGAHHQGYHQLVSSPDVSGPQNLPT